MSRFHSHINTARTILESYKGEQPFAAFIKSFFSSNKKYGSGDRKKISHYCYTYFRVRHLFPEEEVQTIILNGLFLTGHELYEDFPAEWQHKVGEEVMEKLAFLGKSPDDIFPMTSDLSSKINKRDFVLSILEQPLLYLRIRPVKKEKVLKALTAADLIFQSCADDCISLPNGTALDQLIQLDKEAVIQDLNSQRVLDGLESLTLTANPLTVWDCCAGSGGKSILLFDKLRHHQGLRITVTDIRESILKNLRARMSKSGVSLFRCLLHDVSAAVPFQEQFSLIICDVPCSGSGTWGRTPEQMSFFNASKLQEFARKQKHIAENALACLAKDGFFFYITCSVFEEENELVVAYLQEKYSLQLLNQTYHTGYGKKADSLYVALLRR